LKHYHPQKNDQGQPVEIVSPSQPSRLESWQNPESAATATPGAPMPDSISEIDIRSWTECPTNSAGWESLVSACSFDEPPFKANGKAPASGAVVIEPDGRVWIVSPSNQFGGYTHTVPKGKLDPKEALSLRANALKEIYEEAGLHVELIGFLCDATRTTSTTRYYLARRLGGNPADMCWESQAVHLVPQTDLAEYLTNPNDKPLLAKLSNSTAALKKDDIVKYQWGLTSGHRILAAMSGYRRRFGKWPNRILMDKGMASAIKDEVLTPLGWNLLSEKVQLLACDVSTVFAEGADGRFEYDGDHPHLTEKERPDIWIWGVKVYGSKEST